MDPARLQASTYVYVIINISHIDIDDPKACIHHVAVRHRDGGMP
jgi:hypothetical protein